ncbi:hypothetical protein MF271_18380 (plasmid) [Deinococcus sp. KNUC1210]|uniref:hypothetical protein n=1 Tax=Deinococcus sp. KNUC1210 TaxID=2917691 RepID=UPI001EF09A9D|nr:hypothetical protein [Deinococcus sp. KNUC1210]ULH17098.1 hypothetical protein MF271_18380 [Deinococcus sp. KNUC1210]
MTDSKHDQANGTTTLEDALATAQQAIADFEADDGLRFQARLLPDALEVWAEAGQGSGRQAMGYTAARADLEQHGTAWFLRRALRSLNDLYRASHLPTAAQDLPTEQLKPPENYER